LRVLLKLEGVKALKGGVMSLYALKDLRNPKIRRFSQSKFHYDFEDDLPQGLLRFAHDHALR
jgi:hypothetical protein